MRRQPLIQLSQAIDIPESNQLHCNVNKSNTKELIQFIYLPTFTHDTRISRLRNKDIDLTHKDNFSRLTHKSGQIVSLIHDLTKIQFPRKCSKKASNDDFASQRNQNKRKFSSSKQLWKCSNVVSTSSDIFGNVWKCSENRQKSSERTRTFSEIPVLIRRKSHAFDFEKFDGYISLTFQR